MKYEYCPNGNEWDEVSDFSDKRRYYFCDCNKCNGKLYELRPVDITKQYEKRSDLKEIYKRAKLEKDWKKARSMICYDNAKDVIAFLSAK